MTIQDIQITFATTPQQTRTGSRLTAVARSIASGFVRQYETAGATERLRWTPAA